jgi:hypothetical protein
VLILALASITSAEYWNRNRPDPIAFLASYGQTHFQGGFNVTNMTVCWKDTSIRGAGTVIDSCPTPPNTERDVGLCYPKCKIDFYGIGPVCWQRCPPDFRDEGALCARDGKIIAADNSACPWYDECGLVTAKGCSKCPSSEWHNDGCTCRIDPIVKAKESYGRGAGVPLGCAPPKMLEDGLCYRPCQSKNYTGVGPVCWQHCPIKFPASGGAICCKDNPTCSEKIVQLATAVLTAVAAAIEAGMDPTQAMAAVKAAIEAILGFVMPICYGV